jgi:NAD(P)H-dependent FMN reductase
MNVPILLGTARQGRMSEHAARWLVARVEEEGHQTELVDVRDYRLAATDNTGQSEEAKRWAEIIKKADGLIVVSPEYNHSYPGELKMMLDMLFAEYKGLPVGICAVSEGDFGGARVVEKLFALFANFGMVSAQYPLNIFRVNDVFAKDGELLDQDYLGKADKFLKSFISCVEKYKR